MIGAKRLLRPSAITMRQIRSAPTCCDEKRRQDEDDDDQETSQQSGRLQPGRGDENRMSVHDVDSERVENKFYKRKKKKDCVI